MTKRILILYTGGTVGMVPSDDGYVPSPGFEQRFCEQLGSSIEQLPEFDVVEFDNLIDSSNLQPSDWNYIATQLTKCWDQYDGFVVLHGTDTMAYTASALSFMLQGLDRPVIVTGSQIPLIQPRSDALSNVVTSIMLAARDEICEVVIYFDGKLLRGNRASKIHSTSFNAFDSPDFPALGDIGIYFQLRNELLLPAGKFTPVIPDFDPKSVVVLPIYPGLQAHTVDALLTSNLRGLILLNYGVGNPPNQNLELMAQFERAIELGVVIVNLSQCRHGPVVQGAYSTGAIFNRLGVIGGSDLTLEAAFTKLHWLLAQKLSVNDIRNLLTQSLCGEC